MHRLILFSGLPGCGKTSLARQIVQDLRCAYFAKDRIQRVLDDHVVGAQPVDGYHMLLDLADDHLALGVDVVLDAAFPMASFRDIAEAIAHQHQARFLPVWCICSDNGVWTARFENRVQYVLGWTPATVEKAREVQSYFEDWERPDILVLDAVNSLTDNLEQLRGYCQII